MGYSTDFYGSFKFNRPVDDLMKEYINAFSYTRRMARDVEVIKRDDPNWREHTLNGDLGIEGEYYVGDEYLGVINYNEPPKTQPGLWCQWIITDGDYLEWDGGEKFHNYVEWLKYLIKNFFAPNDYVLNGEVRYVGEGPDDFGVIVVVDNKVTVHEGVKVVSTNAIVKRAEQCLIDNGIDEDEVQTVLQALGYILMDTELYPDDENV